MKDPLFSNQQPDFFDTVETEQTTSVKPNSTELLKKRLSKLLAETEDFRLLERVPITKPNVNLPYKLCDAAGDEIAIVFLDTETTGLSPETDVIIELGLVRAMFSPSKKRLVSINRIVSAYEDPGIPIPQSVTELTGITDEKVKGQHIDEAMVSEYLNDAFLIVAHNASFDRPFFEKRFKGFEEKEWACSHKGIDWSRFHFKKQNQEYLLLESGYFYEAHRASIDCLALAWLLHVHNHAFADLLDQAAKKTITVRAFGAPFEVKDVLKTRGYHWHGGTTGPNRHWWKEIPEEALVDEKNFLDELYPNGSDYAGFFVKTAANRFKKE